jgi:hypothetical protein
VPEVNSFDAELRDLIQAYRARIGVSLEDLIEALDQATEELVEEVNAMVA